MLTCMRIQMATKRGAFCNTDHHLVLVKLYFGRRHCFGPLRQRSLQDMMRYDVRKLSHHVTLYTSVCYLETELESFSRSRSVNGTH